MVKHLDLPTDLRPALVALGADSQAGTALSRSQGPPVRLRPPERRRVAQALAALPQVLTPTPMLRNTVRLDA